MKKLLLTTLICCTATLYAQTPCENGMAGVYPCNGIDLLSEMTASELGSSNANDSWGWTDPETGSEYALVGLNDGTAFINIDDPVNPIYLGRLDTHTSSSIWRDIKTYNNYAFIVSEASQHGMQVFDLTRLRDVNNPPVTFTEDAHYSGFGNAHNLVINEDLGFAYGVGTSTFNGGPHFVDISDPLNPTAAGGFSVDSYSHDGQVVMYNGPDADYTGREIYIGSNEDYISIVDITDKSNPQAIKQVTYPNTEYTHQGWFTEDQRYFLLGDELDEVFMGNLTRTIVFDFQDLDNPVLHLEYEGPSGATDHNGYVRGDTFYLASYSAGVRLIDISDIGDQIMNETSFFDVLPQNDLAGFDGAWNVYPYFESGTLLVTTLDFNGNGFVPGMLLVRDSTLSLEDNPDAISFSVYPNPASDFLNIRAQFGMIESVRIVDATGKRVIKRRKRNRNRGSETTIDISELASGLYFVIINDTIVKKVMKK